MGFSKIITIENQTGSGANTLNGRGNLPALSTISATNGAEGAALPAVRINQTLNEFLTAMVTGYYFQQLTFNGSPTYVTNQNGIFSSTDGDNSFPFKLFYNKVLGYNTLDYTLSATGQACASGLQTSVIYWTLSTTALTGTSAGAATAMPITVSNAGVSFDGGVTTTPVLSSITNVFCLPSYFPSSSEPVYLCFDEFARKQQFLG
jgi:hypothetical protein